MWDMNTNGLTTPSILCKMCCNVQMAALQYWGLPNDVAKNQNRTQHVLLKEIAALNNPPRALTEKHGQKQQGGNGRAS